MKTLEFRLDWTPAVPPPPRRIWFDMLGATVGSGLYNNVLTAVVSSESGSCSVPLGTYPAGTVVRVRFSVKAFTEVPYIIASVVQHDLPLPQRVLPPVGTPPKKLDILERWTEEFQYTVQ